MTDRTLDAIALGTCYVDTNVASFPFNNDGKLGEELIGEEYEVVPGGSAVNFCRLGTELGLRTVFIGMAGSDANGDTLEELLKRQGVQPALIRRPELLTNIGFAITNPQGEHIMIVAGTANAALDPALVVPKLQETLPKAHLLYLGGCLKLQSFMHAFGEIADLAQQHETRLAIDHGRVPETVSTEMLEAVRALALRATYYFPSKEEFCALWEVASIEVGLRYLHEKAPSLTTVVKDGANGAYYWANDAMRQTPAEQVNAVVNATGAGDSFNTGVLAALRKERPLADAVAYGCSMAAAKISSKGLPPLI